MLQTAVYQYICPCGNARTVTGRQFNSGLIYCSSSCKLAGTEAKRGKILGIVKFSPIKPAPYIPFLHGNKAVKEAVMERELKIGMHLVFIDADRVERDALLICIHGDPLGRMSISSRKTAREMSAEEKMSDQWKADSHHPPIYYYEVDGDGKQIVDYREPGQHWPCVNLCVVDKNKGAEDQYGRQTQKEGITSIVHWKDNSAHGFCFRFVDEKIEGQPAPSIK